MAIPRFFVNGGVKILIVFRVEEDCKKFFSLCVTIKLVFKLWDGHFYVFLDGVSRKMEEPKFQLFFIQGRILKSFSFCVMTRLVFKLWDLYF